MKPTDFQKNTYTDCNVENNDKDTILNLAVM